MIAGLRLLAGFAAASLASMGNPALGVELAGEQPASPPRRRRRSQRGQALANLSRNHPDYGLTIEEHEARKAARAKGGA